MESVREAHNTSVDLATFVDHHECHFPTTVKLVDGFCGTNEDDSLEVDQILVFFKVETQKTIVAVDQLGQTLCVQQNSENKVHLLPLECHNEYTMVKDLLTAQTSYFLVLEDILSVGIVSGSKLKLPRNRRGIHNYLNCQIVDLNTSREIALPQYLTGRFLPLLDVKDFYLDEVLAENRLPVNIRFIQSQSSRTTDPLTAQSLSRLGNIRLTSKTDVEMVFAASFDNEITLYLFPKSLDINVSYGFTHSAETGKKIKECKQALEMSGTSLKRLDDVIKSSFYSKRCPVRRFKMPSFKIPPVPCPRFARAKQNEASQKLLSEYRKESAKHDCLLLTSDKCRRFAPNRKPIFAKYQEEGNYENCETSGMPEVFTESKNIKTTNSCLPASETGDGGVYVNDENKINCMEVPPLPPKTRTQSIVVEDEATQSNSQPNSPSRPVPKPRNRRKTETRVTSEECTSQMEQTKLEDRNELECTESAQRLRALSQDHVEEICPELPPRPTFLLGAHMNSEEDKSLISQEDNPPLLPERKTISKGETPPPLPARNQSLPHIDQSLAYLAVDVSDWKKIEGMMYAEVKDDGRVFKPGDAKNAFLGVLLKPDETEDYQFMKDQRPEGKVTREQPDIHRKPCDDTESLRSKEAQLVEEESSDDDHAYEEMEDPRENSHGELSKGNNEEKQKEKEVKLPPEICSKGNNEEKQKKKEVKLPSKIRSSTNSSNTQCTAQTNQVTSRLGNNNDIWISSRRDEDCMDFKDIEHFFKLRKQLNAARVQVENLKKQITVKEEKEDENYNVLVSSKQAESNLQTGPALGSGTNIEKKTLRPVPLPENIAPGKVGQIVQECEPIKPIVADSDDNDSYEERYERKYVNQEISVENHSADKVNAGNDKQSISDSTDDEIHSIYYNTVEIERSRYFQLGNSSDAGKDEQSISDSPDDGNNSIYYNTVETETSSYLQLGNSSEEDDDVYENVNKAQGSVREDANEKRSILGSSAFEKNPHHVEEACITEPPPLPPKKRTSSSSSCGYAHDYA